MTVADLVAFPVFQHSSVELERLAGNHAIVVAAGIAEQAGRCRKGSLAVGALVGRLRAWRKESIHAREETLLPVAGAVFDEGEAYPRGPDLLEPAHVLRAVKTSPRHRDLMKREPDGRVEHASFHRERRGVGVEPGVAVELDRREWRQMFLALELGEAHRIARDAKRLARRPSRGLMLAVPVDRRAAENRDDDLRPKPADHPDDVLEDRVAGPVAPRLVLGLGEPEVVCAGEELAGTIETPRGEQLFGPEEAERLAQLRSDEVLPSLAAVEREVRRLGAHPPDEEREQLGVLVVGMRPDNKDPLLVAQKAKLAGAHDQTAGGRRLELRP